MTESQPVYLTAVLKSPEQWRESYAFYVKSTSGDVYQLCPKDYLSCKPNMQQRPLMMCEDTKGVLLARALWPSYRRMDDEYDEKMLRMLREAMERPQDYFFAQDLAYWRQQVEEKEMVGRFGGFHQETEEMKHTLAVVLMFMHSTVIVWGEEEPSDRRLYLSVECRKSSNPLPMAESSKIESSDRLLLMHYPISWLFALHTKLNSMTDSRNSPCMTDMGCQAVGLFMLALKATMLQGKFIVGPPIRRSDAFFEGRTALTAEQKDVAFRKGFRYLRGSPGTMYWMLRFVVVGCRMHWARKRWHPDRLRSAPEDGFETLASKRARWTAEGVMGE